MKVLKSLEEVEAAGLSPPVCAAAHGVLKNLIYAYAQHGETYDPEEDGYLIVIEGGESDAEVEADIAHRISGRVDSFSPTHRAAQNPRNKREPVETP